MGLVVGELCLPKGCVPAPAWWFSRDLIWTQGLVDVVNMGVTLRIKIKKKKRMIIKIVKIYLGPSLVLLWAVWGQFIFR